MTRISARGARPVVVVAASVVRPPPEPGVDPRIRQVVKLVVGHDAVLRVREHHAREVAIGDPDVVDEVVSNPRPGRNVKNPELPA